MSNDLVSAMARGEEAKLLVEFEDLNRIQAGWSGASDRGIKAMVSGLILDNLNDAHITEDDSHKLNKEILVHLSSPLGDCTVNLATVLAFASSYIREQHQIAVNSVRESE